MTSGEYLKQLEKYLREASAELTMKMRWNHFTEYFADAGPENEQAVIKELGTPETGSRRADAESSGQKVDEREANGKGRKQKEKKNGQAPTSSGSRFSPCLQPRSEPPILISILIVLLCAALCAALLDMSVFLIAVVGVAAGIKMLLRGILAVLGSSADSALLPEWAFSCWESVFCARCSAYTLQNGWDGCSCGVHVR